MKGKQNTRKLVRRKTSKQNTISATVLEFHLWIPPSVLLLCKLLDISPEQLLKDFLEILSFNSWKRPERQKQRSILTEYIVENNYGSQFYHPNDIREMFRELDALGLLYPKDGEEKTVDTYVSYRTMFYTYWFDKWAKKYRRQIN